MTEHAPDDVTVIEPAQGRPEVRRRHAANRAAWDQAAVRYTEELPAAVERLRAGHSSVHPVERAALGDLAPWCRRAVHLQCASGEDTLSLLTEGAGEVVGVDISAAHIANARSTAAALGAPAEFHVCDVLDTPRELDGTADLVYTGRGALCWLHDLDGWAAVAARLLRPGGLLSVFDGHPAAWLFDREPAHPRYSGIDYFAHAESNIGWSADYIGALAGEPSVKYERLWTIGQVVQALIDAGLTITRLAELPDAFWAEFPNMPEEVRRRLPSTFLLHARR
ncbi:class I SAM-dependent methyltransferase [Marinactinospora rubrisoli]|uniref:Class I SAM-dependent methyltransferase n=1 Tax=Marinactinospora rubrisoli TaxID=2715399 RepID=A0ABW2KPB4_9ACTN